MGAEVIEDVEIEGIGPIVSSITEDWLFRRGGFESGKTYWLLCDSKYDDMEECDLTQFTYAMMAIDISDPGEEKHMVGMVACFVSYEDAALFKLRNKSIAAYAPMAPVDRIFEDIKKIAMAKARLGTPDVRGFALIEGSTNSVIELVFVR